jgi:hypothetical protein
MARGVATQTRPEGEASMRAEAEHLVQLFSTADGVAKEQVDKFAFDGVGICVLARLQHS